MNRANYVYSIAHCSNFCYPIYVLFFHLQEGIYSFHPYMTELILESICMYVCMIDAKNSKN